MLECERCELGPDEHSLLHWCDNQSFRWVDSEPDTPPLSGIAIDGQTCVAYGERDGVLYILDVYETEASGSVAPLHSSTFRPRFLPQARPVSWRGGIIFAAAVAISTSTLAVILLRIAINTIRGHA